MPPAPGKTPDKAKRRIIDYIREGKDIKQEDLDLIRAHFPEVYKKGIDFMKGRGKVMSSNAANPTTASQDITSSAPAATTNTASPGTKRVTKDDSLGTTPAPKLRKTVQPVLSTPSPALLSRFKPIDDGKPKRKDIGETIGNHLVPVGCLSKDPDPQRVVFASIRLSGIMDIIAFPLNAEFQAFDTTPEHEKNVESNVSIAETVDWFESNVTLDRGIEPRDFWGAKGYVFEKMKKTEEGKERLKAWATVDESSRDGVQCYAERLQDAEAVMKEPNLDPWAASEQDVTLPFFANQVFTMYNNEVEITQSLVDAMDNVKRLMRDLTDLSDREQAKDMRNALWATMLKIEALRNLRNIKDGAERIRQQLFEDGKKVNWRLKELDDDKA